MSGRVAGKVAFITGAARGQGRSHALRLAEEGADIIALDICKQLASARYDLATSEDLAETRKAVEALGRRVVTVEADVRDEQQLAEAFHAGVAEIGPVDIVIANAGVALFATDEPHEAWQDTIDTNLTGVLNTLETAVPSMIERGQGGAIVLTSSTAGLRGILGPSRGALAYVASKHGMVGLMRSYANNLAAHSIRVNTVNPTGVETPMIATPRSRHSSSRTRSSFHMSRTQCRSVSSRCRTSATRCSTWYPTTAATSPARRCRSTPASTTRTEEIDHDWTS